MHAYHVIVRTLSGAIPYTAIGLSSAAVASAAIARYGVCSVSVQPLRLP